MRVTHVISDETGQRIARALEATLKGSVLTYDESEGEYKGVSAYFNSMRDGKIYSVSIPNGSAVACTKQDANAGIANPTLGTNVVAGVDPYTACAPFYHEDVNATVDADGKPHITAINGDGMFSRTGGNGDVFVMAPVLYYRMSDEGDNTVLSICDTQMPGFSPQPGAKLPDGSMRPCMIYAKYPLSTFGGSPSSVSGQQPRTRDVSHNSGITICSNSTTGYSLVTPADKWYWSVMHLLKYATKNSQSVYQGCTNYNVIKPVTVAATSQKHVIIAKGHGLVIGSAIMVGTEHTDRNNAAAHDVLDYGVITGIESHDGDNDKILLDRAVTTAVDNYILTAPWPTGCCDDVQGDGSPTSATSGKEPFVLQGIELAHGMYEVMHGVALKYDGSACNVMVLHDTKDEATTINDSYEDTGVDLPAGASEVWNYPLKITDAGGMLVGTGSGGSTTTGVCDGAYTNKSTTVADREFLSLGYLNVGSIAGLWCVNAYSALSNTWWYIGSRLSGIGRSRG